MRVKLLHDVIQNGQVKTTIREKRGTIVFWRAGNVIPMSDASAEKFISQGLAEPYVEPATDADEE